MRQIKMPIELVYLNEMCSICSSNNENVESDETREQKKKQNTPSVHSISGTANKSNWHLLQSASFRWFLLHRFAKMNESTGSAQNAV